MSLTLNDIKHPKISTWVNEMIAMCEPDNVVVVDGSKEEYDALMQKLSRLCPLLRFHRQIFHPS